MTIAMAIYCGVRGMHYTMGARAFTPLQLTKLRVGRKIQALLQGLNIEAA